MMSYEPPKQTIAVAAYLENDEGEVLLVRTHWRKDTWEMPGGNVEVGEPLDEAVCREFLEETGIRISPIGITGIYSNLTKATVGIVFRAKYVSGEINIQPEEILEARFIRLDETNIGDYITRPQQRSRTLDAMKSKNYIPYESWKMEPDYQLVGRLERKNTD